MQTGNQLVRKAINPAAKNLEEKNKRRHQHAVLKKSEEEYS
jgi:hypothetical protein